MMDPDALAAFVNGLIGRAYAAGAAGPDAFDCYGLARFVQRVAFARSLPEAGVDSVMQALGARAARRDWATSLMPVHGGLGLAANRVQGGWHVGVWLEIDRGLLLHALEGAGVVCSSRAQLATMGFGKWKWFRPAVPPAGACLAAA